MLRSSRAPKGQAARQLPVSAFFVIDFRSPVFACGEGVQRAGADTGAADFNNGAVGAGLGAASAFDTDVAVDERPVVYNGNGFFRAIVHAVMLDTVPADIRYIVFIDRARVAGIRKHVNNRKAFVEFAVQRGFCGVDDITSQRLPERHLDTVL